MTAKCRFCGAALRQSLADLGVSPLSNAFISPEDSGKMEPFYPLHAYVCGSCFLAQLDQVAPPQQLFSDYAYFSSYSTSWLDHARQFANAMCERLDLDSNSRVVEIASNDGYLLQFFRDRKVKILGLEPAENVAEVAERAGIPTRRMFFGETAARQLIAEGVSPDLLIGNNVLAHVPDINDFVCGMKLLLAPGGLLSLEFPHLLKLLQFNQFDTIYHEHFSYLSLYTTREIFKRHGLALVDVEELDTHGGSLRVYARHMEKAPHISENVDGVLAAEKEYGLFDLETYSHFGERVRETKRALLSLLIKIRRRGESVVGYGAPAKGNTLLNYCGIGTDFLDYTVDRSPHKQNRLLPGTRIPVFAPEKIEETRPDFIIVLPWNLRDEILNQLDHVRSWGCKFILPIPEVEVLE